MASSLHVAGCAVVAVGFWTLLGFLLIRRLVEPGLALPFSPIAGWAIHGVVMLPVHGLVLFTTKDIAIVAVLSIVVALLVARLQVVPDDLRRADDDVVGVPAWCYVVAAMLAIVVAAAVLPKEIGGSVRLSDPIFDHSKAALVDEMARDGVPPGNPFIGGGPERLAYYYLWHFSAAELSRLMHVSGWEADAAMTFFSAFSSLAAMMGLAVRLCGRSIAAFWVVALAASASARFLLVAVIGEPGLDAWIENPRGFAGWFFQAAWVPQHVAAATCVLLAVYLVTRLARGPTVSTIVAAGLVVAAAFESSTWIGGVVFAIAALVFVPVLVLQTPAAGRRRFVIGLSFVATIALVVAWPFVRDQLTSSTQRQAGPPIAWAPFEVLGARVPGSLRGLLDIPAFWLVLMPIEMMAVYLPGLFAMSRFLRTRGRVSLDHRTIVALVLLTFASLAVAAFLTSTLADNNDLAWRAGLLAATPLIVFSAAGLASWIAERRRLAVILASCALALGLPEAVRMADVNLFGHDREGAQQFAAAPALWKRVREYAGPTERVANNPMSLARMTAWPVNIGWSLLADRRSCYATWELTQVYTSMPHDRLREIDRQFIRVFAGEGTADDVREMATKHDCSVVVVTPEDGAWSRDPFANGGVYELVDEKPDWRIYRRRP